MVSIGRSEEMGTGWSESFAEFRYLLEPGSRPATVSQDSLHCDVLAARELTSSL